MDKPENSSNPVIMIPSELVLACVKAFNAGNLGAALEYYARDAVFELLGVPSDQRNIFTGKNQLRTWFTELSSQHFHFELEIIKAQGSLITTRTQIWSDSTRQLGVAPLTATDQYLIRDGKINYAQRSLHPESVAKLQAAQAHIHE